MQSRCRNIRHQDPLRELEFEREAMAHTQSLLRAALRLTGDRSQAEDLVQETMLRAWRSFHQFESNTNCKAWLFRILLNLSSEKQKQMRRRPQLVASDEPESLKVVPFYSERRGVTQYEVLSALDTLSEEHRTVLMLAVVEGFTCKEIASMLCLPMGTVMSRLSRARMGLRAALASTERRIQKTEIANLPPRQALKGDS